MANTLTKIQSITASGSVNTVEFSSIPATYTDLQIVMSARTVASAVFDYCGINLNNGSAVEVLRLQGTGTSTNSTRGAGGNTFIINGNTATSNIYSTSNIYIANYLTTNAKQIIVDTVTENNATLAYQELIAMYYANSSQPVNLIQLYAVNNFLSATTFTLYGIKKTA
jgi:hypothetical protein